MANTISVLHPRVEDATYDMAYCLADPMPMVLQHFGPFGMQGLTDAKSVGGCDRALAAESGPALADMPNFSNKQPAFLIGDLVGQD